MEFFNLRQKIIVLYYHSVKKSSGKPTMSMSPANHLVHLNFSVLGQVKTQTLRNEWVPRAWIM